MPKNPRIPTTSKGLNVNPNMLTTAEALQLRRQLAKRLNQRMRRLKAKGFDSEVGGAYADYQDLLARFSRADQPSRKTWKMKSIKACRECKSKLYKKC